MIRIYIGFFCVVLLILYVFQRYLKLSVAYTLLISLFYIEICWNICSLLWISQGVYVSEEATYSVSSLAWLRLFIMYIPVMVLSPWIWSISIKKEEQKRVLHRIVLVKSPINPLYALSIVLLIYIWIDLIWAGIPIIEYDSNKYLFLDMYSKLPFIGFLTNTPLKICLIYLGKNYKEESKWKRRIIPVLLLIITIIYNVCRGNKFYGIITNLAFFLLYPIGFGSFHKLSEILKKGFGKVVSLVGVFLGVAYYENSLSGTNAFSRIMQRILCSQAHTFYGIDTIRMNNKVYGVIPQQLSRELEGIMRQWGEMDSRIGMVNVMYRVSPETIVNYYLKRGCRFAGSCVTVSLNALGYIATFVLMILLSLLIGRLFSLFIGALAREEFLLTVVYSYLALSLYSYYRIGNFSYILNYKSLVCTIIAFIIEMVRKKNPRKAG